jgi:Tfx family DNA-binding protein
LIRYNNQFIRKNHFHTINIIFNNFLGSNSNLDELRYNYHLVISGKNYYTCLTTFSCKIMRKNTNLLTDRQIQVLKLRSRGITQARVARQLKTTRENVSILESRARRNIKRAKATIEILEDLGMAIRITIKPDTPVLEMSKLILKKADDENVRLQLDCIDLLEKIKMKAKNKIKAKKVVSPISVVLLPYGDLLVE